MTVLVREQSGAFESTDYAAAAVGGLGGVFGGRETVAEGCIGGYVIETSLLVLCISSLSVVRGMGLVVAGVRVREGREKALGRVKRVVDVEEIFCLERGGDFWGRKGAGY